MTQILFIQGGGEGVHDEWDNKLVASLQTKLGPGFEIRYPRMPNEADPQYEAWKLLLELEFATLADGAILVGHSIGGTMLIHALAEAPPKADIGGVLLVAAPFVGDGGWPSDEIEPKENLGAALPAGAPVFFYRGGDDRTVPIEHVSLYEDAIPGLRVRSLPGRDHQLDNDLSEVAEDIRRLTSSSD